MNDPKQNHNSQNDDFQKADEMDEDDTTGTKGGIADLWDTKEYGDKPISDKSDEKSPVKGKQGFASMSSNDRGKIASLGGRAAHRKGTAHEWTSDEAREAGRRGGKSRKN